MDNDTTIRETEHGYAFVAEVLESRPLTPTSHHIRTSRHPRFEYKPVQYTKLSLTTSEGRGRFNDSRPMSLASTPTRDYLEYGVRVSESAYKQAFVDLEPGDTVLVEGPRGDFLLDPNHDTVLVAGGIGITPLKGMAEYATDAQLDIAVRLVYSNRTADEIAYRTELEALAEANPRFELVHTLTREPEGSEWTGRRGRIDRHLLEEIAGELHEPMFYLCGTPGMVQGLWNTLQSMGVPPERIKYERFWGYHD
ncbi:ferredoxin--NADP reductase [Haloferax sp. DFSO52]|uniref:ferredoxin--NADP reductase n=1 Tax=Haloferax sp. DFSO52 TaxID=3388505 RepID=UPI003A858842